MNQIEINGKMYRFAGQEANLLSFLRDHGIVSHAACDGAGRCGKCKVQYISSAPEASEQCIEHLSQTELDSGFRLACYCSLSASKMTITDQSALYIESRFEFPEIEHERQISFLTVNLNHIGEEAESVQLFIQKTYDLYLSHTVLKKMGQLLSRQGSSSENIPDPQLILLDNEVVSVADKNQPPVILNLDIGTTTIALCAIEAGTKQILSNEKCLNSQVSFGADVINRISSSNAGHFLKICDAVRKSCLALFTLISKQIDVTRVVELNITGNTTMLHFLLRLNPALIGVSPFIGLKQGSSSHSFQDVFYSRKIDCDVNVLPGHSAYIGADIIAGVSYLNMHRTRQINLMVDLGTNGELVIGNQDRMLSASTACGPAFEGGHLDCGMPSLAGAVSRVTQNIQGEFELETVAGLEPKGLCGSAAIDILALLLERGDVDSTGMMDSIYNQKVMLNDEVYFSQKDVRELQLAKSAVRTAIDILISEYGCQYQDIHHVYLSGGFGSNVSIENLIKVGIFPEQLRDKIFVKGNTSLAGAVKYGLMSNRKQDMSQILQSMQLVNLAKANEFNRLYTDNILFNG